MSLKTLERLNRFLRDEQAATAVEYAVMLVLIIAVVIGAVTAVGLATEGGFNKFVNKYDEFVNKSNP